MDFVIVGRPPWFEGPRAALAEALRELGHFALERDGIPPVIEADAMIVLGPHDHGPPPPRGLRIAVWTEQDLPKAAPLYAACRRQYDRVFDVRPDRAVRDGALPIFAWAPWPVREPDWHKDRPIEALFFGTMTQRRFEIVKAVSEKCDLLAPTHGLWGEQKRKALTEAKIVVVVHAYDVPSFEPLRYAEAASCGALVVAEFAPSCEPWKPGEDHIAAESAGLADAVAAALKNWDCSIEVRRRAFEVALEHDATAAAETILQGIGKSMAA